LAIHHHPSIHDPSVEVRPNQPDHSGIIDASSESVDQNVVVYPVEKLGVVQFRPILGNRDEREPTVGIGGQEIL
jgi:hypothetical protein